MHSARRDVDTAVARVRRTDRTVTTHGSASADKAWPPISEILEDIAPAPLSRPPGPNKRILPHRDVLPPR